jgi:hypothetical protein
MYNLRMPSPTRRKSLSLVLIALALIGTLLLKWNANKEAYLAGVRFICAGVQVRPIQDAVMMQDFKRVVERMDKHLSR